jgi:hypothetical protein
VSITDPGRVAYTREQAAEACGLTINAIGAAIRSGALRAKKTAGKDAKKPGKYLITHQALVDWLDNLEDA